MFTRTTILIGVCSGAAGVLVAIGFIAVSLFTEVPRNLWMLLNQAKGAFVFGLCAVAGFFAFRRCGSLKAAVGSGFTAGALAGCLVPIFIYVLAYGCLEQVRQFPFEYHSVRSSAATSDREFLRSERGRQTTFDTTIGLIPIVMTWAALQGSLLGLTGGWISKRLERGKAPSRKD